MSSSKPSNHICPDCGRAYKAAETMNRHRKNHSETSQYTCSICSASFKRKDLLDRHCQIHVGGRQSTSRNRSQRACDRCSRLKTRCDNANPCTRCAKAGHECTYKHVRTRARVDRSSICSSAASATSSVHSSPHVQPADLPPVPREPLSPPEHVKPTFTNPNYSADSTWSQDLWMAEPAWQWPDNLDLDSGMGDASTGLKASQHIPLHGHDSDTAIFLDPALKTGGRHQSSAAVGDFYGDPAADMSWYQRHAVPLGIAPVDSGCSDLSDTLSHSDSDRRHASPDFHSLDNAQAQQQRVVSDLATFSTTAFATGATQPAECTLYWQQSASEVERVFRLEGIAPTSSHIFEHFHHLFFRYFHGSLPRKEYSNAMFRQPHMYLTMAAIGAAYAGPQAEAFHKQMLNVLRPKMMMAAVERQLSDEATLLLIQSLALLQAAMVHFGDRGALDAAPQLAAITVSLARRIQLFDDAKYAQAQNYLGSGINAVDSDMRRRLALGVTRLDEEVAQIFGTQPLLSAGERRLRDAAADVCLPDKLVQTNGPVVAAGLNWNAAEWNKGMVAS